MNGWGFYQTSFNPNFLNWSAATVTLMHPFKTIDLIQQLSNLFFILTIEGKNKGKASIFIKQKPREELNQRMKRDNKAKKIIIPMESLDEDLLEDGDSDVEYIDSTERGELSGGLERLDPNI